MVNLFSITTTLEKKLAIISVSVEHRPIEDKMLFRFNVASASHSFYVDAHIEIVPKEVTIYTRLKSTGKSDELISCASRVLTNSVIACFNTDPVKYKDKMEMNGFEMVKEFMDLAEPAT